MDVLWLIVRKMKPILAPIIESYFRTRDRLKLGYLKATGRSTVKAILNAEGVTSSRVVIFASYPTERLAKFHERFLTKLADQGYSIIIATNHARGKSIFGKYVNVGWCVMLRRPFGRDFGCYKDASLLLYQIQQETGRQFERVIYFNDSVITMDSREEALISYLNCDEFHCAGITENYNKGHHFGSFSMAISGEVLNDRKIVKFWKDFVCLSTRRHAIGAGELKFSKVLRRSGYLYHVQWTLAHMKDRLLEVDFTTLNSIANCMEPHFITKVMPNALEVFDERLQALLGPNFLNPHSQLENGVSGWKGQPPKRGRMQSASSQMAMPMMAGSMLDVDNIALATVRYREQLLNLPQADQIAVSSAGAKELLVDVILRYVFRGSQIHHGAAPLLFLGAGLLKKDVVLRKIVEPYNVVKLLRESKACSLAEEEEVMTEILAKGHPSSLRGKAKLMHDWDFT